MNTKTRITKAAIRKAAETKLEKAVAHWILDRADDYGGDPAGPLKDLFYGGCASGMVGELIATHDCVSFYERHQRDIWTLAIDQADAMGDANVFAMLGAVASGPNVGCMGDYDQVANFLAWFGFEETARILADRVGYED